MKMEHKHLHIISLILYALLAFACLYVAATMNAIHDSYQPGLNAFKAPFSWVSLMILVSGGICVSVALIFKKAGQYISSALHKYGVALISISILVFALGFAPCLKPHPTTGPHHKHHNLKAVVERSLLCPRYSNRSYPAILIFGALGTAMFLTGKVRRKKNA